jgi:hypothetical protein
MMKVKNKKSILAQPLKNSTQITYTKEKNELISLLSSYIKGSAKRDDIYTSLIKLKSSIS